MNVFIINDADHEERYADAEADLIERFNIEPQRWVAQPEGKRQTLQYMMLEALVGDGPWLVTWDHVRFRFDPHRVGSMGDIHVYGGWTGEDPLTSPCKPLAFMVFNNDTRQMLAEAWAPSDLTPTEAWAKVLTGSSVTWDHYDG